MYDPPGKKSQPAGGDFFLPKFPILPGCPNRFDCEATLLISLAFQYIQHIEQSWVTPKPGETGEYIQNVGEIVPNERDFDFSEIGAHVEQIRVLRMTVVPKGQ